MMDELEMLECCDAMIEAAEHYEDINAMSYYEGAKNAINAIRERNDSILFECPLVFEGERVPVERIKECWF